MIDTPQESVISLTEATRAEDVDLYRLCGYGRRPPAGFQTGGLFAGAFAIHFWLKPRRRRLIAVRAAACVTGVLVSAPSPHQPAAAAEN